MENNNGYVYLISSGGKMKVGTTKNSLRARIKNYETHNPQGVNLLHSVFCSDYKKLELILHKKMKLTYVGNDWVTTDNSLIIECKKEMDIFLRKNTPEKNIYNHKKDIRDMSVSTVPFTQVANKILNNKDMTVRAKGLFAYLYSKPDSWNFNYIRIANDHKESKNTILKTLRELESFGYLSREKLPDGRMIYHLTYEPETKDGSLGNPKTKVGRDQSWERPKLGHISNKEIKVIKSINNKEVAEASSAPFNLKEYIQKCYENKSKLIQLIGLYMDYRYESLARKVQTSDQAQAVVKRHLKYAKELQRWSDEQINQGMAEVAKKNSDIDWTLETLFKHLTK